MAAGCAALAEIADPKIHILTRRERDHSRWGSKERHAPSSSTKPTSVKRGAVK